MMSLAILFSSFSAESLYNVRAQEPETPTASETQKPTETYTATQTGTDIPTDTPTDAPTDTPIDTNIPTPSEAVVPNLELLSVSVPVPAETYISLHNS